LFLIRLFSNEYIYLYASFLTFVSCLNKKKTE
jgi:hypothetical protein